MRLHSQGTFIRKNAFVLGFRGFVVHEEVYGKAGCILNLHEELRKAMQSLKS
jgi:hypothetical protein